MRVEICVCVIIVIAFCVCIAFTPIVPKKNTNNNVPILESFLGNRETAPQLDRNEYLFNQVDVMGAPVNYSELSSYVNTTKNPADLIAYPNIDTIFKYENLDCSMHNNDPQIHYASNNKVNAKSTDCIEHSRHVESKIDMDVMAANGKTVHRKFTFVFPSTYIGNHSYIKGHNYATMQHESQGNIDEIGFIMRNNHAGEPVALGSVLR